MLTYLVRDLLLHTDELVELPSSHMKWLALFHLRGGIHSLNLVVTAYGGYIYSTTTGNILYICVKQEVTLCLT